MKTFLRTGLALILLLSVNMVSAQQRGQGMRNVDPETQATQQVKTMKEIVKLNENEEVKVKEIFLAAAKERTKFMQEARESGSREGIREKMTEMNKQRDEKLKKILGEKRMKKYLEEMEKRRSQRQNRRR